MVEGRRVTEVKYRRRRRKGMVGLSRKRGKKMKAEFSEIQKLLTNDPSTKGDSVRELGLHLFRYSRVYRESVPIEGTRSAGTNSDLWPRSDVQPEIRSPSDGPVPRSDDDGGNFAGQRGESAQRLCLHLRSGRSVSVRSNVSGSL